jgi:hypothetical protein
MGSMGYKVSEIIIKKKAKGVDIMFQVISRPDKEIRRWRKPKKKLARTIERKKKLKSISGINLKIKRYGGYFNFPQRRKLIYNRRLTNNKKLDLLTIIIKKNLEQLCCFPSSLQRRVSSGVFSKKHSSQEDMRSLLRNFEVPKGTSGRGNSKFLKELHCLEQGNYFIGENRLDSTLTNLFLSIPRQRTDIGRRLPAMEVRTPSETKFSLLSKRGEKNKSFPPHMVSKETNWFQRNHKGGKISNGNSKFLKELQLPLEVPKGTSEKELFRRKKKVAFF